MDPCVDFGVQMKKKAAQKVEEYMKCVAYWICIYANWLHPQELPLLKWYLL